MLPVFLPLSPLTNPLPHRLARVQCCNTCRLSVPWATSMPQWATAVSFLSVLLLMLKLEQISHNVHYLIPICFSIYDVSLVVSFLFVFLFYVELSSLIGQKVLILIFYNSTAMTFWLQSKSQVYINVLTAIHYQYNSLYCGCSHKLSLTIKTCVLSQ